MRVAAVLISVSLALGLVMECIYLGHTSSVIYGLALVMFLGFSQLPVYRLTFFLIILVLIHLPSVMLLGIIVLFHLIIPVGFL